MSDTYFREANYDEIKYFAEQGYVPGEDLENLNFNNSCNRDSGISVKKQVSHLNLNEAEGYIELYGENLEAVEQDSEVLILTDSLDLSHLVGIHVQEQKDGRDYMLEVANMLEPPHDEIMIRSYQPHSAEIQK